MHAKPFIRLAQARAVARPELPPDLADFYASHEGVGLESSHEQYPVRLCKLDEVTRVGWKEVAPVGDVPQGWENFAAFRLGMGRFFDEIVYVLSAPSCRHGSVLAVGRDMCGPGGGGPFSLESSLVLAASFPGWLAHLEKWGWLEPAVVGWDAGPGPQEARRYYLALNPTMNVGSPQQPGQSDAPRASADDNRS